MTVQELINRLSAFDPNLPVGIQDVCDSDYNRTYFIDNVQHFYGHYMKDATDDDEAIANHVRLS